MRHEQALWWNIQGWWRFKARLTLLYKFFIAVGFGEVKTWLKLSLPAVESRVLSFEPLIQLEYKSSGFWSSHRFKSMLVYTVCLHGRLCAPNVISASFFNHLDVPESVLIFFPAVIHFPFAHPTLLSSPRLWLCTLFHQALPRPEINS